MYNTDYYENLKQKLNVNDDPNQNEISLRIHRANSWLKCANDYYPQGYPLTDAHTGDLDKFFIFSWIAFNAMYGANDNHMENERAKFTVFFTKVLSLDTHSVIYDTLWLNFSNDLRILLNNKYMYLPFWKHTMGVAGYDDWENSFKNTTITVNKALASKHTVTILSVLFDRMYVLRNQMLHGSATYESSLNRPQLKTCCAIIQSLLPTFMTIILQNPQENWGQGAFKPVVDD